MIKLATLINIQLTMTSLRANTITAERALEAPPPPAYHEITEELDSDIVEIHSPEVINAAAAESLVAASDFLMVSEGEPLPLPEKRIIDHYLPEEVSSLILENDHGVSNQRLFFLFTYLFCT